MRRGSFNRRQVREQTVAFGHRGQQAAHEIELVDPVGGAAQQPGTGSQVGRRAHSNQLLWPSSFCPLLPVPPPTSASRCRPVKNPALTGQSCGHDGLQVLQTRLSRRRCDRCDRAGGPARRRLPQPRMFMRMARTPRCHSLRARRVHVGGVVATAQAVQQQYARSRQDANLSGWTSPGRCGRRPVGPRPAFRPADDGATGAAWQRRWFAREARAARETGQIPPWSPAWHGVPCQ